jgi:Glyoxalase/Bleomycin resistance protein/Dioxygenase superfamily
MSEFGQIMQHGYIVNDVAASANEWVTRVGAGPFYVLDRIAMDQYYYRGVHTPVEMRLAFGYWGSIQVELIQPLSDTDTLYSRALRDTAGQLNHCATVVKNIDALLAANKLQSRVIQAGTMPTGLKFVYLEEYLPGGQHLELIEAQEGTLMAFAGMQAASRTWDGRNPLRPMAQLQQDLAASR